MTSKRGTRVRARAIGLLLIMLMAWAGVSAAEGLRARTGTLTASAGHKLTVTVVDSSLYATGAVSAELRLLDESNTSVARLDGLLQPRQPLRLHYTVPTATSVVRLRAVVTLRPVASARLVAPVVTFESAGDDNAPPVGPDDIKVKICPMHTPPVPPPNDGPVTNETGPIIVASPPPPPPPGGDCSDCQVERVP